MKLVFIGLNTINLTFIILVEGMGCSFDKNQIVPSKNSQVYPQLYSKVGLLKIEVKCIQILDNQRISLTSNQYYIKFIFSNKINTSLIHHNFGKTQQIKPINSTFQFILNRNQQVQRNLQVQIYQKQQLRKNITVGQYTLNINQIIRKPKLGSQCNYQSRRFPIISSQSNRIAWVTLEASFIPLQYQILTVKALSVILRDKIQNKRKIYIKMEIGQQIFVSSCSTQTKSQIPEWSDAFSTFIVPSKLTHGAIHVYQKIDSGNIQKILGTLTFDIKAILNQKQSLQTYNQQIVRGGQVTGTMKLQFLKLDSKLIVENPMINQVKKISTRQKFQKDVSLMDQKHAKIQQNLILQTNPADLIIPQQKIYKIEKKLSFPNFPQKKISQKHALPTINFNVIQVIKTENEQDEEKISISKIFQSNPHSQDNKKVQDKPKPISLKDILQQMQQNNFKERLKQNNLKELTMDSENKIKKESIKSEDLNQNQQNSTNQKLITMKTQSIPFQGISQKQNSFERSFVQSNVFQSDFQIDQMRIQKTKQNLFMNLNKYFVKEQRYSKTALKNFQTNDTTSNRRINNNFFKINLKQIDKKKKQKQQQKQIKRQKQEQPIIEFQVNQKRHHQNQQIKVFKNPLSKKQLEGGFTAFNLDLQSNLESSDNEWQIVNINYEKVKNKGKKDIYKPFSKPLNNLKKQTAQKKKQKIIQKELQLFKQQLAEQMKFQLYQRKFEDKSKQV